VGAGAVVKQGDPLVIIESMKMEFAVLASGHNPANIDRFHHVRAD